MPRPLATSSPNYECKSNHLALTDFSPATNREPPAWTTCSHGVSIVSSSWRGNRYKPGISILKKMLMWHEHNVFLRGEQYRKSRIFYPKN